jgi:hypothetical protein
MMMQCRCAGSDRPISGRATRKDLVLFAKELKGNEEGAREVEGLDKIDPEGLLAATTGAQKESNRKLLKAFTEDMKDHKAPVCHNYSAFLASLAFQNATQFTTQHATYC